MSEKVHLDIVSDLVCPWCIIGYKRLEKAILELDIQEKTEIEWHPFELNPHLPEKGEDLPTHLSKKYGMSNAESLRTLNHMASLGAEVGFKFDFFDGMKSLPTRDVHVLLDYAKESGKQTELYLSLFKAYFSDRQNISDRKVLSTVVESVGLMADSAMQRLEDENAHRKVEEQKAYWRNRGVTAVPTIFTKFSGPIRGAQPVTVYKQFLSDWIEKAT